MKHYITLKLLPFALLVFSVISCSNNRNQIATVNYDFSGCFGGGKSSLTIYKVDTTIIAELESYDKPLLKAKISTTQLDTFKMFVKDLKNLNAGAGCTTVSHYSVFYMNEVINKTDAGCDWNGFSNLRDCLFRNPFYLVQAN